MEWLEVVKKIKNISYTSFLNHVLPLVITDNGDRNKNAIVNGSLICVKRSLLYNRYCDNCFAKSRLLSQDAKKMVCPNKIVFTGCQVDFYYNFGIHLVLIWVNLFKMINLHSTFKLHSSLKIWQVGHYRDQKF